MDSVSLVRGNALEPDGVVRGEHKKTVVAKQAIKIWKFYKDYIALYLHI